MVIHQFNKLIRNKWVWGAFAIAISAFFAFDFLVADLNRSDRESPSGSYGKLAGEPISGALFQDLVEEVRGFGQQRDWRRNAGEVNREAWENYAALKIAELDGVEATDADVQAMIRNDRSFQQNGGFNFALYQALLRQNGLTPERFEAFIKRRLTLMRVGEAMLGAAAWTSPMELDQAVADMTDTFTVKVAEFSPDKKDMGAIKLDDAALKKWYSDNVKSLELPERIKIRYIKYNATDPKVLAKMTISEDEMRDRYDVTIDKYTSTDTNGVEQVKPFEEVKPIIEKELRKIAAVQYFETNLNYRVYAEKDEGSAKATTSRLDEIAKADGVKVETSEWFSIDGAYQEGFMVRMNSVCPGAKDFSAAVAELDPSIEYSRYAIVSSESAVWVIERADASAKHTPTFEEAKTAIAPRALRDAKDDAFKAKVEAVAAKGIAAIEATPGVTTNITFTVADLGPNQNAFANQMAVARAAMTLKKGEVSEFVKINRNKAILVACVDRVAGDAAKAQILRGQVRNDLSMLQMRQLPESWKKWNLDRMGFETSDMTSVEVVEEEE